MAKQIYSVNWRLEGLGDRVLGKGDTVVLDDDIAAPLLASGVLTPSRGEATLPTGAALAQMTKAELVEWAAATIALELSMANSKAEIIAEIEAVTSVREHSA